MSNSKLTYYSVDFELTLKTPFMTKGTGSMRFGLDTFSQTESGKLVINGSQIRGILRQQLSQFDSLLADDSLKSLIEYAFGQESRNGEFVAHFEGSALTFPWKFIEVTVEPQVEQLSGDKLYRIKIDEETGIAEEGHIQVIENKYPVGSLVTFKGQGYYLESEQYSASQLESWINKALKSIDSIGAFKSIGFGEVVEANCIFNIKHSGNVETQDIAPLTQQPLRVAFTADRPICFAKPRAKTSNLFVSEQYIPGNAIKAALIKGAYYQSLDENAPLKKYINDLAVTHAKPISQVTNEKDKNEKLLAPWSKYTPSKSLPLSLLQFSMTGKQVYLDAAQFQEPIILKGKSGITAGAFPTDAKGSVPIEVQSAYGSISPQVKRQLVVRTAVNSDTLSADDGQLFSYETISNENMVWLAQFSLPTTTEGGSEIKKEEAESTGRQLLEALSYGLHQLGKTKAKLLYEDSQSVKISRPGKGESIVKLSIKLESDALLFEGKDIEDEMHSDLNPLTELLKQYFRSHVFKEADVPLVACYADTRLVGGDYLLHKFGKDKPYQPQVLVTAGSVFTFDIQKLSEVEKEHVINQLSNILHTGLPTPKAEWTFETTPYIPQNGFGQISWLPQSVIQTHQSVPEGYTILNAKTLTRIGAQDG